MNISDLKFYSLLFIALVVIGYVYLGQADDRENAYSEADYIEEDTAVAGEIEQEPNSIGGIETAQADEDLMENTPGARGVIQLVGMKD